MIDSTYIDGPVRKLGLASTDHFLFPVGKIPRMRWLELRNASGDFTIEFVKSNPYELSSGMNGVDHISGIEYWKVESSSAASARVELSFDNVNSGGVTDLSSLRVAQLSGNWMNQGNVGTTGSAGAAGSVASSLLSDFTSPHRFFTLASTLSFQNPLPLRPIVLSSNIIDNEIEFECDIGTDMMLKKIILEYSTDQSYYYPVQQLVFEEGVYAYRFQSTKNKNGCYRVRAIKDAEIYFSNIIHINSLGKKFYLDCVNNIHSNQILYSIDSRDNGKCWIQLFNGNGQLVAGKELQIKKGRQQIIWNIAGYLPNGMYFLVGTEGKERTNTIKIMKE
jgi:hypothetical protein